MAQPSTDAAKQDPPRRALRRRVSRKDDNFHRKVEDLGPDGQELFVHPSHPKYIVLAPRSSAPLELRERWNCDVCAYLWAPDKEQRMRYQCIDPSDGFTICSECMFSRWSAWRAQKQAFLGGGHVEFPNIALLGTVSWNPSEVPPGDREGVEARLDELMRQGRLPWHGKRDRCMRISCGTMDIVTRPRSSHKDPDGTPGSSPGPTVLESHALDDVFNLIYLDDAPSHLIVIFAGPSPQRSVATVIRVPSPEVGFAVAEAFEHVVNFVHQQAVLQSVDDNILAALEGHPTEAEAKREEEKRRRRASFRLKAALTDPETEVTGAAVDLHKSRSENPPSPTRKPSVMDMFKILEDPPSEDEEESAVASVNEVTSLNKSSSTREQNDVAAPSLAAWPGLARDTRRSDGHYIRSDVDRGRGAAPAAALEDFMLVLKRELNVEGEMAEFADVLRQYRATRNFGQFAQRLSVLFGPRRHFLLPGMRHFVPVSDRQRYEEFLSRLR